MTFRGRALRALAVAVLAFGATGCPPPAEVGALLLDEGFPGTALARSRWGTCHWWGPDGCTILTNDELEWYRAEQVEVRGGVLRLTARPEVTVAEGRTFPYLSGMVSSGRPGDEPTDRPRFAFTYGRVEARFRVPRGTGLWPAIWMLPVTNRSLPEIDLVEVYGHAPDRPSMTFHDSAGGRKRREVQTADLSVGWHTVVLDWSRDRLTWSIDGVDRFSVTGAQVPREPMYLVANLAVGGPAGAPTAATRFPATFLVDSVRVWAAP
ncbi:MAG TPA: glycoside hydrolase family 16 protein [Acidimicrobiales bacterium]|nr:glycoside hydrolase family 16 protein [Acidimicrobiales bacterium]